MHNNNDNYNKNNNNYIKLLTSIYLLCILKIKAYILKAPLDASKRKKILKNILRLFETFEEIV